MNPPRRGRIDVIDGARGVSMLLVFLSHFVETYFQASPRRTHSFMMVTRIASPAFMWISGTTLAVLFAKGAQWIARTRDRLFDRAAFLLLVCHPLMVGAYLMKATSFRDGARILFITDTIAVCLMIGAFLVPLLAARRRALLGLVLLLGGWFVTVMWNPTVGSWAWRIKDTLAGDWRDHWANYSFPLVPWLGFFLIATAPGAWFVRAWDAGQRRQIAAIAAACGTASFVAAQLVAMLGHVVVRLPILHAHVAALTLLASSEKLPPTPVYFLRYGGLALIVFALLLVSQETKRGVRFVQWAALFGRCSVVAYVIQYYVYYGYEFLLPRPPERWAPLYFVATVGLIWVVVRQWERAGGNRLITIGYPEIFGRRRAPQPADAPPETADPAARELAPTPASISGWEQPPTRPKWNDRP